MKSRVSPSVAMKESLKKKKETFETESDNI